MMDETPEQTAHPMAKARAAKRKTWDLPEDVLAEHNEAIAWWKENADRRCPRCRRTMRLSYQMTATPRRGTYRTPAHVCPGNAHHRGNRRCGQSPLTPTSLTVAHGTNLPLGIWVRAADEFLKNPNINGKPLGKLLGVKEMTALKMIRRFKEAIIVLRMQQIDEERKSRVGSRRAGRRGRRRST